MPGRVPLDDRALARVVAPFGESRTLPAGAYTSPEVFDWEQSELFASTWVCLGRLDELVAPGQVRGVEVAGEGMMRGTGNRGYRPGPLSAWEGTVYQFLTVMGHLYRGEGLVVPTAPDRDGSAYSRTTGPS